MQIDERVVNGVTILDLKGKMTLGEGDELLKDKINSLIQQDRKKLLLNLEGVPYIDSAGLGEIVRTYTTVSRQGGKLKLLNLTKRIQDLLAITKLLTVFETYESEPDAVKSFSRLARPEHHPPRSGWRDIQYSGHHRAGRSSAGDSVRPMALSLVLSLRPSQWTKNLIIFGALLFGQRLLDRARGRRTRRRRLRHLLRALGRRLPHQRCRRSRRRSAASAEAASPDRLGRAVAVGAGDRLRRWRSAVAALAAAFWLRPMFGVVAAAYVALLALYSGPLKHIVIIDVLTIAIGFVLRAAGGRRGDRRADQPLAAASSRFCCALFLALSKRRHELVLLADGATSHRPILEEYSPYLLDQMISVVTASTLVAYAFYTVSPETVQKFHTDRPRPDAAVSALRNLPLPLSGAPEGGRRQPGRHAAERSAAARLRGASGPPRWPSSSTDRVLTSSRADMPKSKVAILRTTPGDRPARLPRADEPRRLPGRHRARTPTRRSRSTSRGTSSFPAARRRPGSSKASSAR